MFKDLLTSQQDLQPTQSSIKKQDSISKSKLQFHSIQCPKTGQPLSSKRCKKCSFKKEFTRYHESGSTLNTLICLWNNSDE